MGTEHLPTFGDLLQRYRRAAGLTQEALAERAGLSVQGISALERGINRTPRKDTVALLATALALPERDRATLLAAASRRDDLTAVPAAGPACGTGAHPDPGAAPPLVGRTRELALLERHLAGAGPPLLLLAGEPGIGKSRLLQEAGRQAVGVGLCVLRGGCQRRGGQDPYAPLLGALQSHRRARLPIHLRRDLQGCAWLVRLLPELAAGPIEPLPAWALAPEQERRLMFEAVAHFLANVAGPAGTLLVLDDLQWAGADALDLLRTLAHAAGEARLRVVGAYRDTEVRPEDPLGGTLADLAQAGLATQQTLRPLAPQEAAHLLDGLLTRDPSRGPEDGAAAPQGLRERLLQRAGCPSSW